MHRFFRDRLSASACLLALAVPAAGFWAGTAHAEVRRCMKPNGEMVYTDHRCEQIGAVERTADDESATTSSRIYRTGCPRTVQDLVFEMTLAFDARDVNRLASLYHWAGLSSGAANSAMQRLDRLVQQPLVAIVPVMAPAANAVDPLDPIRSYRATVSYQAPRPVAVRIEQTVGDSVTPSQTVFDLYPYFGCLWIRG